MVHREPKLRSQSCSTRPRCGGAGLFLGLHAEAARRAPPHTLLSRSLGLRHALPRTRSPFRRLHPVARHGVRARSCWNRGAAAEGQRLGRCAAPRTKPAYSSYELRSSDVLEYGFPLITSFFAVDASVSTSDLQQRSTAATRRPAAKWTLRLRLMRRCFTHSDTFASHTLRSAGGAYAMPSTIGISSAPSSRVSGPSSTRRP